MTIPARGRDERVDGDEGGRMKGRREWKDANDGRGKEREKRKGVGEGEWGGGEEGKRIK